MWQKLWNIFYKWIILKLSDLYHEQIDEIPVIVGVCQRLHLAELVHKHLGTQRTTRRIKQRTIVYRLARLYFITRNLYQSRRRGMGRPSVSRFVLCTRDCKMSALETRFNRVQQGDFYLMPLALTSKPAGSFNLWVARAVEGQESATLRWEGKTLLF